MSDYSKFNKIIVFPIENQQEDGCFKLVVVQVHTFMICQYDLKNFQ